MFVWSIGIALKCMTALFHVLHRRTLKCMKGICMLYVVVLKRLIEVWLRGVLNVFSNDFTFSSFQFFFDSTCLCAFSLHVVFVPRTCCFTLTVLYKSIPIMEGYYGEELSKIY